MITLQDKQSFSDVSLIINKMMPEYMKAKINKNFINFIEQNKDLQYITSIDINKPLKYQTLSKNTIVLLGLIYRDFLSTSKK